MKEQPVKKKIVRNRKINSEKQLLCVPLVAGNSAELWKQALENMTLEPDLIEWRVDSFANTGEIIEILAQLRKIIKDVPLIFTLRHQKEGGKLELPVETRITLIKEALATGMIDFVDFEIENGPSLISEIRKQAKKYETTLILSYHNFEFTPPEEQLISKVKEAKDQGADIAKIAVMPNTPRDVLTLLSVLLTIRQEIGDLPLITIAMGSLGILSRIAGGPFGSSIVYVGGQTCSAPGQIGIEDFRKIRDILKRYTL